MDTVVITATDENGFFTRAGQSYLLSSYITLSSQCNPVYLTLPYPLNLTLPYASSPEQVSISYTLSSNITLSPQCNTV